MTIVGSPPRNTATWSGVRFAGAGWNCMANPLRDLPKAALFAEYGVLTQSESGQGYEDSLAPLTRKGWVQVDV